MQERQSVEDPRVQRCLNSVRITLHPDMRPATNKPVIDGLRRQFTDEIVALVAIKLTNLGQPTALKQAQILQHALEKPLAGDPLVTPSSNGGADEGSK